MRAWLVLALLVAAPAVAQPPMNWILHIDPTEFVDGAPIPAVDYRILHCGTAPGSYPMSMVMFTTRVTPGELLEMVPVAMDRTHYCVATTHVAEEGSAPSNEIRFFCDRVGTGKPDTRPLVCWEGERIPPGHR